MKAKNLTPLFIVAAFCFFQCCSLKKNSHKHNAGPFIRSMFGNTNVYKTQDTLRLTRVYDLEAKRPIHDTMQYLLKPDFNFFRYTVIQDGDNPVIKILPVYKFGNKTTMNKITTQDVVINRDSIAKQNDKSYFQFKSKSTDLPTYNYFLATEHLTAIPITMPVKIRLTSAPNQIPVSLNASLSSAFGYRIRVNNNAYKENYLRVILLAAGISSDTYLQRDSVKNKKYTGQSTVALNIASGLTFEAANRFNVGAFIGFDKMFSGQRDWVYQNKPWLGIGFGFSFGGTTTPAGTSSAAASTTATTTTSGGVNSTATPTITITRAKVKNPYSIDR